MVLLNLKLNRGLGVGVVLGAINAQKLSTMMVEDERTRWARQAQGAF